MNSKTHIIEIFLLVLVLVFHHFVSSFEINFALISISVVFLFLINKSNIYKHDFELLSILILILIIGVFSAFYNKPSFYNFFKNLLYFTKPILSILLGYLLAKKINNWEIIFKIIIYIGVFFATLHLGHLLIYTNFHNADISYIRKINGLGNFIEMFAIILILVSLKHRTFNVLSNKIIRIFFLILLSASVSFYFSRTMFVAIFLISLSALGYAKLNLKGLKYGFILIIGILTLYTYLVNSNINRQGNGLESFLYKLKIAPTEIFSPKLDLNDKAYLWDHWRAYEAYRALKEFNNHWYNYPFGKGFGALVDLKFTAPLNEKGMRFIPILHNGYVWIMYQTGVTGLLLYLLFIGYLYIQSYKKTTIFKAKIFSDIIAGLGIYLLFSSLIITGLYNLEEIMPIMIGIFLFLKSNSNRTTALFNENSDTRN